MDIMSISMQWHDAHDWHALVQVLELYEAEPVPQL